jgi:hypothetical protein
MSGKVFQNDVGITMIPAGLGSVGSYQMSGIPYVTASLTVAANTVTPTVVQFPFVAKFVTIINTGSAVTPNLKVGFSALGVSGSGTNYFTLTFGQSYTGDWRIEDIYLQSATTSPTSASIIAGLTPIPRGVPSFVSTGNNWSGSAGIG